MGRGEEIVKRVAKSRGELPRRRRRERVFRRTRHSETERVIGQNWHRRPKRRPKLHHAHQQKEGQKHSLLRHRHRMPGRKLQVELFKPNFPVGHANLLLRPNDRRLRIRRGRVRRGNEEKDSRFATRREFSRVMCSTRMEKTMERKPWWTRRSVESPTNIFVIQNILHHQK